MSEEKSNEKSLQIYPSKKIFMGSDKMKKRIFDAVDDEEVRDVRENKSKRREIITPLEMHFTEEFKAEKNLTAFDELVFDCCISEQFAGNEYTTPAIIHRLMGGSKTNFSPAEKEKILNSVRKLSCGWIKFDISEVCKEFGYNDGAEYKYHGPIMPAEYVTRTINGRVDSAAIHFLRQSPLLDVAKIKGQFIISDPKLLDVPIKNNETVLSIKSYLWRRVLQIIGSHKEHKKHFCGRIKGGGVNHKTAKGLPKTILLDTLFEQCGLLDATNNRKAEYRNTISKIMEHFKAVGLIKEWHFGKEKGKFCSIEFDWGNVNL